MGNQRHGGIGQMYGGGGSFHNRSDSNASDFKPIGKNGAEEGPPEFK